MTLWWISDETANRTGNTAKNALPNRRPSSKTHNPERTTPNILISFGWEHKTATCYVIKLVLNVDFPSNSTFPPISKLQKPMLCQEVYKDNSGSNKRSDLMHCPFRSNMEACLYQLTFTELRVVSMEYLQRVWLARRERLPVRTPGCIPPFGDLLMLQLLRPVVPNLPYLFSTFHLEYPSVLSQFCLWYLITCENA